VVVVSTDKWEPLVRLQSILPVVSLGFGPHGRLLAAGTDDDHLVIWSLPELRDALQTRGALEWRENISPNGRPVPLPAPGQQAIPDSLREDRPSLAEIFPRDPRDPETVLDLEPLLNRPLEPREGLAAGFREMPADLPLGLADFGGAPFDVRGVLQMASRGGGLFARRWPSKVSLAVGQRAVRRVHLLATTRGGVEAETGTVVMRVRCTWAGGTTTETPVRLGIEIGDGWHEPERPRVADRSSAVWQGISESSETARSVVRLYRFAVEAPRPGIGLERCELESGNSAATPLVFGVTVE
jgi:hypothetical protein